MGLLEDCSLPEPLVWSRAGQHLRALCKSFVLQALSRFERPAILINPSSIEFRFAVMQLVPAHPASCGSATQTA